MLEFICGIPAAIGWTLVGVVGMACAFMLYKLGKLFVQMWKEWHEDDDENE